MVIDIHTHTFPDRIAPMAIDKLKHASRTIPFSDGTVSGLCASMEHAGVDWSVVLPVATNPAKTASLNDASIAQTGKHGLIHFGAIHPDTPDALSELEHIAQAGLKGVKIHPVYQGVDIDDPRYLRILDKAGQLGLIVLMHAGEDIGFPGVVRCSPEMTARALRQAGPVKVICAHMGGWHNWNEVVDYLGPTSVMLDTAFTLGEITPLEEGDYTKEERLMLAGEPFVQLIKAFGSERILFGSDSPWADQATYIEQFCALDLTQEEKRNILGENARKLLGI